jgi:hypothetical protein
MGRSVHCSSRGFWTFLGGEVYFSWISIVTHHGYDHLVRKCSRDYLVCDGANAQSMSPVPPEGRQDGSSARRKREVWLQPADRLRIEVRIDCYHAPTSSRLMKYSSIQALVLRQGADHEFELLFGLFRLLVRIVFVI